jgi:predicted methyltransferase
MRMGMKKSSLVVFALLAALPACEMMSPPMDPPQAVPPPVAAPPPVETTPPPPPPPPEPTAEEKKQAEEAKKKAEAAARLAADRAQWETDSRVEADRWTSDLRKDTKALVTGKYPNVKAAITAALKSKHRSPKSAARDAHRHPLETLEFFGLKPTMTVLEYGPGEGWYTEILAPVLAAKGKLIVTTGDPNGPAESRGTFYAQRFARFLDNGAEAYGKVERLVLAGPQAKLDLDGKVDLIILTRELHGMHNDRRVHRFLEEAFRALKPGGFVGVEQHRARPDANPDEISKKGYLPEAWVVEQFEKAGFKLAGKAEINANAKDTKDYAEGVWALPPSYELKDKDRARYAEIGESDRMTLKFVKPAAAVAKPAGKPAAAPKPKK